MPKHMFLPETPWVRPTAARGDEGPQFNLDEVRALVIHWPEAKGWGLTELYEYLCQQAKGGRYGSYHFAVGPVNSDSWGKQYDTWNLVPRGEMVYHVGAYYYTPWAKRKLSMNPNRDTLGVCYMHRYWGGKPDQQTERELIRLLADLCEMHGLNPLTDIVTHNWVTAKCTNRGPCPRYYFEHGMNDLTYSVRGLIESRRLNRGSRDPLDRSLFSIE